LRHRRITHAAEDEKGSVLCATIGTNHSQIGESRRGDLRLSRLESGARKPTLELLLPLADLYDVPLDQLVGAPRTGDPRIHLRPVNRNGMTYVPLGHPGGVQAHKLLVSPKPRHEPKLRTHEGFEWLFVLAGRLRLILGHQASVLKAGEAAEFDTHVPHWLGRDDDQTVELVVLFGHQGERAHLKARTT
jgi:quercetin dioxygenase-like cupin family protein